MHLQSLVLLTSSWLPVQVRGGQVRERERERDRRDRGKRGRGGAGEQRREEQREGNYIYQRPIDRPMAVVTGK